MDTEVEMAMELPLVRRRQFSNSFTPLDGGQTHWIGV